MAKYKRTTVITLSILLVAILLVGVVTYYLSAPGGYFDRERADIRTSTETESNPYMSLGGTPIDLTEFQGKPIVINVWATWSSFSAKELPILNSLQKEFGDRISIIAMNRNESPTTVEAYRATISDTSNLMFVQDTSDYFFESVGGYAMPETIFYDATGNIVNRIRGTLTESEFREHLEALTQ